MDDLTLINNTSVYRNPAPQSPLQGAGVMQPAAVYSKIMLRTIELSESDYVFDSIATERTMPSNNGSNEIVFKRMLSLAAHTQPLVEGIPPASDQGRMVAIKGSTKSYGRVMKFTDKVNWAVVDPLISEYTRQLSLKIPETKDILAQEALLSECQTFYAQPKKLFEGAHDPDTYVLDTTARAVNHIKFMSDACTPTLDEFRKIVLSQEACKVRPYTNGLFLALVSSAVMFDLITDHRVKEYMRYANTGKAYEQDVVIDLFSLMFKKAKTIKTDNTYVDGDGNTCYIYTTGNKNYIFVGADKAAAAGTAKVIVADIAAGTSSETTKTALSVSLDDLEVLNIHHSFVIGEEALFRLGVEGHTAPQFIKKELGSAGTEDPLNQRQSIGWKIDSLGYKVVNPDAIVDYMSVPSQYKVNVHARPDMKNEFTDYYYGYVGVTNGKYYHPEQVMQTVVNGAVKYYVKGTTIEVEAVKLTSLVKPINGGRVQGDGKKAVVKGDVPTMQFALASNVSIRFAKDQVFKDEDDGKYYIKGLAKSTNTEVINIEAAGGVFYESEEELRADGTGKERKIVGVEHGDVNLTGDHRIDD